MTRQRPALKLLAPFLLLAALGFALDGWIYARRISHTMAQAETSRLQFTLTDLKTDIEQGLAQGYGIRDLANAQPALEAEARLDPDIDLITVVDRNGAIAHQAGPNAQVRGSPSAVVALAGPRGEPAGQLAAWLSPRSRDAVNARARIGLLLAALCATLFSATAAMAAMAWLGRRKDDVLEAISEGLEQPARAGDPRIVRLVDEVNQQASNTLVSIAAARHLASQRNPDG